MGRMTKLTTAAASALLVLGVAACGDDDDPVATTDPTVAPTEDTTDDTSAPAEGDTAAFCDGLLEFNGAVNTIDLGEESTEDDIKTAGQELSDLWTPVVDNAPEDVAEQAAELDGILDQMVGGDGEAFDSEDTFTTYSEIVDGAVSSCEYETVDVTGVDYAFEGVPATLPAGTAAFRFTNGSESEEHEMIIARKADGVDLTWDEILGMPEDESESLVDFTAAAFAPPGGSSNALGNLEPGEYVMVCFVPVGGAEDGPPHFAQGRRAEYTVSCPLPWVGERRPRVGAGAPPRPGSALPRRLPRVLHSRYDA